MQSASLIQKLKRCRLISELSENLLGELATSGVLRRYKASEPVYLQADAPKAAYLVVSGMVNREAMQEEGTVIQNSRMLAGDWLGLANAASRIVPYMHSAIVADTSEILAYDIRSLARLRLNPEFLDYLLHVTAKEQLLEEERHLNTLSSTRSYDKLILFLAAEIGRVQKRGVSMIHMPFLVGTQKYFADAIGVSRETVVRDLQPLMAAGIIERTPGVRPRRYTILKQAALCDLAASPLLRSTLYAGIRGSKTHRRFSDVA